MKKVKKGAPTLRPEFELVPVEPDTAAIKCQLCRCTICRNKAEGTCKPCTDCAAWTKSCIYYREAKNAFEILVRLGVLKEPRKEREEDRCQH